MVNIHRVVAAASAFALIATLAVAAQTRRVHLKSTNYRYASKQIRNRGVRLVHRNSNAPCVLGRSWGYNNNQIWVNKGCEADFEYVVRRHR